ncbi:MAG: HutD family protein [Pseudochelatococcus sp.]|jgi:environmental stress-induced protein Ves|uniref:HutD/Ves family protein n=1 Tax=Pseudochelatococcus sp. TaxID=2020869 RepID=UPI003D902A8E
MKIIRNGDFRRMPWKNGGGETLEVAVHPPMASVNDFDWRVSMAKVAADGPFSGFPGVDRTLAVLEGEGIELMVAAGPAKTLRRESEPYSFPADVPTGARLLGGPITDLNVMSRRGRYTHRVRRHVVEGMALLRSDADTLLVIGASPWFAAGPRAEMEPFDLLMPDRGGAQIYVRHGRALFYLVEIEPDPV